MRVSILGIGIDPLSMSETVERIRQAIHTQSRLRVVTANPEIIYAAQRNKQLKELINSAGLVTADGVGVVWAAKYLKTPVKERVTGIDLIQALFPIAGAEKWRIFFLGGKPGIAKEAARKTAQVFPGIVWEAAHGYFSPTEEAKLVEQIRRFHPDLLLVGLGFPKQEVWIHSHPDLATVSIGVGGSFDALAGVVKRAPEWAQNLKLEWLYRLCKEPWRWRRQMVLPKFVAKVIWSKVFGA